ncbi:hypothetical protein GCM10022280_02300 [Sphingomonas swuensis]|uniref:Uncharacterized protein n=1 Tax=Sphingomonas swuensis TaxID=977800 RepID=A0ABP7SB12_9SPHN
MSERYEGGLDRADRWGCGVAMVVGVPLFAFLVLLDALGDCAPDAACRRGFLLMVLVPTLLIAGAAGLGIRHLIRRREGER